MSALTERLTAALPEGLRLTGFGNDVINLTTTGREMTPADVEAFRAALTEAGHVEVESWIASQGVSWLSDGVFAGVSFRVRARLMNRTCTSQQHGGGWFVTVREANYSTFNGGHRTPSAYSEVRCRLCNRRWRTKAAYVRTLPDA